jgi:hypothetical protein
LKNNIPHFIRLTALWAFVEAGLGGFLHAFHLPFTGIILGGFAVIIISLLAQCFEKPFFKILQSTIIVLAIKVIVNPATSPFAYVAVGFQGILGAFLYSLNKKYFITHFLYATISMLESAAQKLLIMTLFLGNTFWQGVDGLGQTVAKIFGTGSAHAASDLLIVLYLSIFLVWGILLSIWMHFIPQQLDRRKNWYANMLPNKLTKNKVQKQHNYLRWIAIIILVLGLISLFYNQENGLMNGIIYLIRTLCIIIIWQWIVLPIWHKRIAKWSANYSQKNTSFLEVQAMMPSIQNLVKPLYTVVSSRYSGLKKWKEFLLGLIVVSLNLGDAK